jgi:LmbE family N-acetylglucosaminyl deacetylase
VFTLVVRLTGIVCEMSTVILSPHLDDAVLSCWHVLTRPGELTVINVFAGAPVGLGALAWWDRYTGATDFAERVRERIEEDRRALALAGRTAVNLGFLDEQYRREAELLAPLTEQIERLLAPGARIYAPAALPTMWITRSCGRRRLTCAWPASPFRSMPTFRMPPRMAGPHGLRAGAGRPRRTWLEHGGTMCLPEPARWRPAVQQLDAEDYAHKLKAVHMYGTQLQALAKLARRPLIDPGMLGYEVAWSTASRARAGETPAHRV